METIPISDNRYINKESKLYKQETLESFLAKEEIKHMIYILYTMKYNKQ